MNDNLLPLRKACLLAKLLSGSAKEKKINPKQIATLFSSEKVAGHLPVDETATRAAVAELLAEGIIEERRTGKTAAYFANSRTKGYLESLPLFPPADTTVKAFVLLSLLAGGSKAVALKAITPPPALGLARGALPMVLSMLEQEKLIHAAASADNTCEFVQYTITEQGKRALVQWQQHPKATFKALSGDVINALIQLASRPAAGVSPPVQKPDRPMETAAALTDDLLLNEARGLMREVGQNDLLPIHALRRHLRGKYGERAASHELLDPQLKRLRGNRLRLVAIGDRSRAKPDELVDGVNGVEELFFYVRDLR